MFKLVVLSAFLAVAAAAPGYLGAPLAGYSGYSGYAAPYAAPYAASYAAPYGAPLVGHGVLGAAPVLHAPVVKTAIPYATSYANTVRVASPVVAAHGPLVAAHAPAYVNPYAHGW